MLSDRSGSNTGDLQTCQSTTEQNIRTREKRETLISPEMKNRRTSIPVPAEISSILESGLAPLDLSWVQEIPDLELEPSNQPGINSEMMGVGGELSELILSCDQVPYSRTLSKHEPENTPTHSGHQPMPDIVATSISKKYELNQTIPENIYQSGISSPKPGSGDVVSRRGFNGLDESLQPTVESWDDNDVDPVPPSSTESTFQYHGSNRLKEGSVLRTESNVGNGIRPVTPNSKSELAQTLTNSKPKKYTTIHDIKRKLTEEDKDSLRAQEEPIIFESEQPCKVATGEHEVLDQPIENLERDVDNENIKEIVSARIPENDCLREEKVVEVPVEQKNVCKETCSAAKEHEITKDKRSYTNNSQVEQGLKNVETMNEPINKPNYDFKDENQKIAEDISRIYGNIKSEKSDKLNKTLEKIEESQPPNHSFLLDTTHKAQEKIKDESFGTVRSRVMRINNLSERKDSFNKFRSFELENNNEIKVGKVLNQDLETELTVEDDKNLEVTARHSEKEMQKSVNEFRIEVKVADPQKNMHLKDVQEGEEERVKIEIDDLCSPTEIEAKDLRRKGLHEILKPPCQDKVEYEREESVLKPIDSDQVSDNKEMKGFSSNSSLKGDIRDPQDVNSDGVNFQAHSNIESTFLTTTDEDKFSTIDNPDPENSKLIEPLFETREMLIDKSKFEPATVLTGSGDKVVTTNPPTHYATHSPNYPEILKNKTTPTDFENTGVLIGRSELEMVPRIGNDEYGSETSSMDWRREGWSDRSEVDDEDTRNLLKPIILIQSWSEF